MCTTTQGERFKDARTVYNQHGSQSMNEVYNVTGVSASMIKDLEDDEKIRSVGYDKIAILAKHYGVSADYLLGLSPYPTVDKDLEFVCKYTGLSETSVKYLRQLMDIYNGVIAHPKALQKIENDKQDKDFEQETIEFYRTNAIAPIMALNTILSCDLQKEILSDISYFLQIEGSTRYNGEDTALSVVMATKNDNLSFGAELPIEAIAWGYLKKAENSLSELRNQFENKLFIDDIS